MRVLIVEDEANTRRGISRLIQQYTKHQVVGEAKSGFEGLELAKRMRPDLIFTDIRMPGMSGLEMLEQLFGNKAGDHDDIYVVILSGYADFDYARKAISMDGKVLDYLLKPIDVEKMISGMEEWEKAIRNKRIKQDRPDVLLRNVLLGNVRLDWEIEERLKVICKLAEESNYFLFWGYTGSMNEEYEGDVRKRFLKFKEKGCCQNVYFMTAERQKSVMCLLTDVSSEAEIIGEMKTREVERYAGKSEYPVWAMERFGNLREIQEKAERLQQYISYGLVFEGGRLIQEADVDAFAEERFSYPYEIEKAMKVAVCSGKSGEVEKAFGKFEEYIRGRNYLPEQIWQGYRKLISYMQDLTGEMNMPAGKKLQQLQLLPGLQSCVVWREIEELAKKATECFGEFAGEKNTISNYVILKAIAYIREHYAEGITLEEVAHKLAITPEYLSTLFSREMNTNFTTFVKEFRISYARRLLKGTDMKIYEIAAKVGYQDPKYFTRVFKEVQGVSPGEYREG